MDNHNKKEEEKREFQYVYFIENHLLSSKVNLELQPKNDEEAGDLQSVKQEYFNQNNMKFIYSIFRFTIFSSKIKENRNNNKKNFNIKVILNDFSYEQKEQFEKQIEIRDINIDNFLFDFKFEESKGWVVKYEPPLSASFSYEDQFQIYIDYLRKDLKLLQESDQNQGLIKSIQSFLIGKDKKYNFSLYLMIFLECFSSKLVLRHLISFKPEKIKDIGILSEKKRKQSIGILGRMEKNPKLILNKIENKEKEYGLDYFIKLFSIILFFNMNFNKERIPELFSKEENKVYLYHALIDNKNLFKKIKLDSDQINYLIKISQNYEQIIAALSYNNNMQNLLDLILLNIDKIYDIIQNALESYKNNNNEGLEPTIDIESLATPSKKDNLKPISELYNVIILYESERTHFIKFKQTIFVNYIKLFESEDINNFFYLKKMINITKEKLKIDLKIDMNKLIHETGIYQALIGKLKNKNLLQFIVNDEYYNSPAYKKKIYRSLDILKGIDISTLDDDFYKQWKKIKWEDIFPDEFNLFYEKILEFINDLNDFKILFKLLDKSNNENQYDFDSKALELMQNKMEFLLKSYNQEKHTNLIDDLKLLIYFSDIKNCKTEKFLTKTIQPLLNINLLNQIYINLLTQYGDEISQKTKHVIIKFFTDNPGNANADSLLYLIENCKKYSKNIFQNLEKYIVPKEDFLKLEETDNYKLFKGLLDKKFFEKNDIQNINYFQKTKYNLNEIRKNIESGEINLVNISIFYNQNKGEDKLGEKLFDKLIKISLNNIELALKYKKILDNYYSTIMEKINDMQLIVDDLLKFYETKENQKIEEIKNIINVFKKGKLNLYEKYYIDKCNIILNNYKDKAIERAEKIKSIFYLIIYKENKELFKNNEDTCLNETEKKFEKLKELFTKGIQFMNKSILEFCLKAIKNKNESEIEKEIEILSNIYKIKNYDKKKIKKSLILLSKKEDLFNISIAIALFLEKVGSKGDIYEKLNKIIKNLEKSSEENIIVEAINKLNQYSINIDTLNDQKKKGNNNYLKIFLKLKEQPDAIVFLLKKTIEECRNMQELIGEMDNALINANDILDLEKCVEFMNKLGDEEQLKKKKDIDIINLFRKEAEKSKDIEIYFERYINNYSELKSFVDYGFDKSEASKKIISFICEKSIFTLTNIKDKFFKGIYYGNIENKKNKNENEINLDALLELRDRAQLTKKVTGDNEELKTLENNKKFIQKVSEIYNISELLEDIYYAGYPEYIEIKININFLESTYNTSDLTTKDFQKINIKLKNIINDLKKAQLKAYKYKPVMRFIYGREFNLIYNILKKKEKNNNTIIPLLKYLSNNLIKNQISNFTYKQSGDLYEDLINNCEQYILETLKLNKLSLEKIYKESFIVEEKKANVKNNIRFGQGELKKKVVYKGVFLRGCTELEKQLFQIYKYFTNNAPSAQSILLCNKETTSEELIAFLYRSILCDYNSCFILGGVELLEFDKKTILLELLNDLFVENHDQMKSFLIILYTNNKSDIYKSLVLLKYKQVLDNLPKDLEKIKLEDSKVEIISSDKTGVGKSTQIKLDVESNKKKYIYFPLGGSFSRKDVIKRLQNLEIPNESAIHLDLYNTEETELMTEFLFSILITKLYGQNEDIVYLSKDIEFKIEIPNCFIDFKKKFPILTLFNAKELKINNLDKLIVPKEVYSNVQIVSNYLKALKDNTLDNQDLFIDTITPEIFLTNNEFLHTIKANSLSQNECQDLIFTEIKKTIPEPNYYQIKSFIDILATQFKKFNQSYYLNTNVFEEFNVDRALRTFIIESFIKITKYFTKGAFNEILSSQEIFQKQFFGSYNENLDLDSAMKKLAENEHEVVSFNKIDPSLLFFHEGNGEGFSIITKKEKGDDEYEQLLHLMNCQARGQDRYEIPNYKECKPEKFLEKLRMVLDIKNPIDENERLEKPEYRDGKTLKEIAGSYVFTADNFVKMVLILLRIRANIPVIMMGETGCGKTSLIRKLSEFINNGSTDKMKIMNIHAGVNDNDIIKFLEENVIKEAKELEEIEKTIQFLEYEKGFSYFPKKMWVFLDEINTCKSMGLISELMCKNSYQGKTLPSNIVFIAACNPYRKGTKNNAIKAGLDLNKASKEMKNNLNEKEIEKIKQSMDSTLVYTVNPLPHSLLNFVFDFGKLTEEDEIKYIESIILEPIHKYFYENKEKMDENDLNKIHTFAKEMIVCSQNFIRIKNDISSVSLREIRRFNIFYEFFIKYLKEKKEMSNNDSLENIQVENKDKFYKNLDSFSLQIYSIILSIFVCYYLRITDTKVREELKIKLNEIINKFDERFKDIDFLNIPEKEELYVVDNIKLEKGIAKNRALKDNIFSLFVAINNKVPIFIVGKPGCSKSLSVQLINKAMKGNSSNSPLFKKLPKIILNSYQGSMGSTSEGVLKVFKIARSKIKNLKEEDKKNNISMIFFDEMGLAEHSPNNPLKVIHAELEYDLNEGDKKVAFVGISNWALDASKMNRGIFLSIPDPGPNDTRETALIIGKSYDDNLAEKYKGFFEFFGEIYFKYKDFLRQYHNQDGKDEFHGNRDFYHLVKIAARMLVNLKADLITDNDLKDISVKSVERNFGGMKFEGNPSTSLEVVKKLLKEKYIEINISKDYLVLNRIEENIKDSQSRYLLVISKSSISIFLLSSILSNLDKESSFYIGSQFQNDLQSEEYTLKILNKIQLHMEHGKVLILKNLESVYPALYDLFNQNFQEMGNKKFARIAIGSSTNTFSFVNNNFRCIVNVDEKLIDGEEPPFLNRFEKHIISFEYLLNEDLLKKSNEIYDILMKLISYEKNIYKGINYNLKKLFINSDLEEIQGIIYQSFKNGITNYEDEVISKVSLILPQDIIICSKINGFQTKYPEISKKILDSYDKGKHSSLREFIEFMENRKNVVYTFNNIFDVIYDLDDIPSKLLGDIKLNNIKNIKISSFKSENELEKVIDEFLIESKFKLCLIKFTANEGNFLNYIKFLIENKERDYLLSKNDEKDFKKAFIFIVHLSRIPNYDLDNYEKKNEKEKYEIKKKILKETISHLSGYYQIFIDDLNGKTNFSINNMINLNGKELFMKCLDVDEALRLNIYISLSYMKYNFSSKLGDLDEDTYVNKLIDYIEKDKDLRDNINKCIINQMDKEEDIISTIFKNENSVSKDDLDMISIIQRYLSDLFLKKLNLLYFMAEKDQFFSSLLSTEEKKETKKKQNKKINVIEDEDEDENDAIKENNKDINIKNEENNIEDNNNIKEIKNRAKNIYLEKKFNFENKEDVEKKYIIEQPGMNKINIILGLNIPGIKYTITSIIQKFNNDFSAKYMKNENLLRDDLEEVDIENQKNKYFRELKFLNDSTFI